MAKSLVKRQYFGMILAIWAGLIVTIASAFFISIVPISLLERFVSATGFASLMSAAQPPLGGTARALLALTGGVGMGLIVGMVFLAVDLAGRHRPTVNLLPLSVRHDLGVWPELEEAASSIEPRSVDLSRPSAGAGHLYFDIAAIKALAEPTNADPLDLGGWPVIEAAEASIIPEPPVGEEASSSSPEGESIEALMRRLEDGIARREEQGMGAVPLPAAGRSNSQLRSTLAELRKMASR